MHAFERPKKKKGKRFPGLSEARPLHLKLIRSIQSPSAMTVAATSSIRSAMTVAARSSIRLSVLLHRPNPRRFYSPPPTSSPLGPPQRPLIDPKFTDWAQRSVRRLMLGKLFFGGLAFLCFSDIVYAYGYDEWRKWRIDKAFAGASFAGVEGVIIPRPREAETLWRLFTLTKVKDYFVITGEHGTGKTTLACDVIQRLEKPTGVIYLDSRSPPQFLEAFTQALNWNPPYKRVTRAIIEMVFRIPPREGEVIVDEMSGCGMKLINWQTPDPRKNKFGRILLTEPFALKRKMAG